MGDAARSIGGYEVLGQMGAGTVGTVYRARQIAMDRIVALKILNARYAADPSFVKGFIVEARTAGRINHPNVCQVYDVGNEGGVYFFSMELVDGPTLEQVLKKRGRLPSDEALRIVRGVASALAAAHTHGLVHRDVKPANIILADSGEPKLVDLGVAKDVTAPGADLGSGLVGTPYYMPPEQGQGRPVDIRSDIYALGATFYHLLVGRPPFMGPHPTAVIVKHASEPLTPPSSLDPEIPRAVSAVVERMMAKKPEDRYPTPASLIADLDRVKDGGVKDGGLTLEAEPAPARAPAMGHRRAARRRPMVRATGRAARGRSIAVPVAVGGGAVLVALVLSMVMSGGKDPAVVRAERELSRASSLLGRDEADAADEAAGIAASVLRSLPAKSELRRRASRIVERAGDKRAAFEIRRLDGIVLAVAEGTRGAEKAMAAVEKVRRLWEASRTSRGVRGRVTRHCGEALAKIDAMAAKPAEPREPTLGDLAKATLERVGKALEGNLYAEAMGAVTDGIGRTRGHDRSTLEAARSRIRKQAGKDFSGLMRDTQEKIDAGDFVQASLDLGAAQSRFAFGPYPGQLEARIAELREIAAASAAASAADDARVAEETRAAEEARAVEEARAAEDAHAAEEARAAEELKAALAEAKATAEDEADAEAAADAAAQIAAAAFFEKEGWEPEGGTWRLEKDVLTLVVPEGSTAKLVYGKGIRVTDVTTQFDARVLGGKGLRLQCRWTEGAGGGPDLGRFGARDVDLGKGYALFMDESEVSLQVRGAPARGLRGFRNIFDYQTWTKKLVRGAEWNRYVFQARGSRIAAVVNGRVQLTRVDDSFQSGMVRFEFLEGSRVEMRDLRIRAQ